MFAFHRSRAIALSASSVLIVGMAATAAYADGEPSPDSMIVRNGAQWYTQAYENTPTGSYTTPDQSDVAGPQRAPFGPGSHRMAVGQFEVQTELYRTNAYDGVDLGEITRLEYSTFARNTAGGADRQPTYLRLSVDDDNNGTLDTSLFFFPANNGTVVNGVWQDWDVDSGMLNINGDPGAGTTTLEDYAIDNPSAVLINSKFDPAYDAGAISLIAGSAATQTRGEYFVDRVIVGESGQDTLFDFGPSAETTGSITPLTVNPANRQGWQSQAYNANAYLISNQDFVTGPGTPPLGTGSLRMSLPAGETPERVELFRTERYDGTLLRDLRTIEYATYSRANAGNVNPQQPIYLRLSLSNDGGTGTDDTIFFYPANNGMPAQSTWQTWDAGSGDWSSVNDPGTEFTLADYVVAHPDATIVKNEDGADLSQVDGGVAFIAGGSGLPTQTDGEYFLDAITITRVDAPTGSVDSGERFDLEPTAAPGGGGGGGGTVEPSVSVGDAQVSEGNSGATLTFPVTVTNPTTQPVTVQYSTSDGTATAGNDYTATTGELTIPAGQATAQITVPVLSDTVVEPDETLTLTLTSPGFGTLGDGTATGTILNDDQEVVVEPSVSVGDAEVLEGNSGATLSFPLTVTNPTTQPVTVQYSTADGTATAGSDYTATTGEVTIPAGQATARIDVPVLSDTVREPDETLTLTITAPGFGTVGDGSATGTIVNDDQAATPRADIGLQLYGPNNAGKDDRPTANARANAAGLVVRLFRRVDGELEFIKRARLDDRGDHRFTVADLNRRAKTVYVVKVARTATTKSDTASRAIR